jgi:hypothetical protein
LAHRLPYPSRRGLRPRRGCRPEADPRFTPHVSGFLEAGRARRRWLRIVRRSRTVNEQDLLACCLMKSMARKWSPQAIRWRWILYKFSPLLAIGAALVFSLFFTYAGLAYQNDKKQDTCVLMARDMKGTANLSIKQISSTPTPCGGRTGASCRKDSLAGSRAMATDGSRYTITTSESAAGMLFGTSLIVLVAIGARRLRHHHERHALLPSDRACRAQLASLVHASRARASESN